MREDTPARAEVEYTEEQVKILEHYYFENQLRQIDYDLEF
jgi:hypothetical protein